MQTVPKPSSQTISASFDSVVWARRIQIVPSAQAKAAPCIHRMPAGLPASRSSSFDSSRPMASSTAATATPSRSVSFCW